MNTSELKLRIFRHIDSLEKSKLEEFYGVLKNYINTKKDINDWSNLTTEQRQGILDAIEEIDNGKGITHENVIAKYRNHYTNA
jgi:hypothetical protein